MHYIADICIDTHKDLAGVKTEVIDKASGKVIPNVYKAEVIIQATEVVGAKLTLYAFDPGPGGLTLVRDEELVAPHVDLKPLVAVLQPVTCGEYQVDGDSWKLHKNGDYSVVFHKVTEGDQS